MLAVFVLDLDIGIRFEVVSGVWGFTLMGLERFHALQHKSCFRSSTAVIGHLNGESSFSWQKLIGNADSRFGSKFYQYWRV